MVISDRASSGLRQCPVFTFKAGVAIIDAYIKRHRRELPHPATTATPTGRRCCMGARTAATSQLTVAASSRLTKQQRHPSGCLFAFPASNHDNYSRHQTLHQEPHRSRCGERPHAQGGAAPTWRAPTCACGTRRSIASALLSTTTQGETGASTRCTTSPTRFRTRWRE